MQDQSDRILQLLYRMVLGLFLLLMASMTLRFADTDLFYHLAGGRYFFEHLEPANPSLHSFLGFHKVHNYFWGFQATAYILFAGFEYYGLIALRVVLMGLTAMLATRLLLSDHPITSRGWYAFPLVVLVLMLLAPRGISLRPHLFSMLFIVSFLYLLYHRPRWWPLLPVLAIGWINTHGIEWVVGALICGGFVFQKLIDSLDNHGTVADALRQCFWPLLCLPALLLNPDGYGVLLTPWEAPPEIYQYITELQAISVNPKLAVGLPLNYLELALLLLVVWAWGCFCAIKQWRRNIGVLGISLGGLILLMTSQRFVWEWLLLSLPVLAIGLDQIRWEKSLNPARLLLLAAVLVMAVANEARREALYWPRYPVDVASLPLGTTDFIQQTQVEGRYVSVPTWAGLAEFELAPGIQIHSHMQTPPFDGLDHAEVQRAYRSATVFAHLVSSHQPDFVAVPREVKIFASIAAATSRYVPVYFDTHLVLYVDSKMHPELSDQYALRVVNPHDPDAVKAGDRLAAIAELRRMGTVSEHDYASRLSLAGLLLEAGKPDAAEPVLESLASVIPGNAKLLFYQGQTAYLQEDCGTAIPFFEQATKASATPHLVGLKLAECQFRAGDLAAAFASYQQYLDIYKAVDLYDAEQFYFFAVSAAAVGETRTLTHLVAIMEMHDDGSRPELLQKAREML